MYIPGYDLWKTTPPDDYDPIQELVDRKIYDIDFLNQKEWFDDCISENGEIN